MKILEWVGSHYAPAGISLFAFAVSLLVAVLGTALPQAGLRSRWPRRLAACAGILLLLIGGTSAAAKLRWPHPLRHVPWSGPPLVAVFGLLLIFSAWLSLRHFRKRTRRQLQPVINAAWQTVGHFPWDASDVDGIVLRTPNGRPVIRELLAMTGRRRPSQVTLMEAPAGAGKTSSLVELANRCHTAKAEKHGRTVIPVYIDLAIFAKRAERPPLRTFILTEINPDGGLTQHIDTVWRDGSSLNVSWVFLFDNADRLLERWPGAQGTYDWAKELSGFLGATGHGSHAVVAGRNVANPPGGVRVEIAPLNSQSRRIFLKSRHVAEAQQEMISSGKSFQPYAGNPGWLDFISPYLAEHPRDAPGSFYDLMRECIAQRMPQGVPGEWFQDIAAELAIQLYDGAEAGRANIRMTLVKQLLQRRGCPPDEVQSLLDDLGSTGLVSYYLDQDGHECLQFSHGSFEDYFATARLLLAAPGALDLERILTARRRTAIAVSLLQHGSDDMVSGLTAAAENILTRVAQARVAPAEALINGFLRSAQIPERDPAADSGVPAAWPTLAYTVLRVLMPARRRIRSQRQSNCAPRRTDWLPVHSRNAPGRSKLRLSTFSGLLMTMWLPPCVP